MADSAPALPHGAETPGPKTNQDRILATLKQLSAHLTCLEEQKGPGLLETGGASGRAGEAGPSGDSDKH